MKRIQPTASREIFGNREPVQHITECQFDYLDDELKKLARTPWENLDETDLWYYLHDLAYVQLQPDLFDYLFPLCLNFWYNTLMRDESANIGDADFHYSLRRGKILEKMLSPHQREQVYNFMCDGFLDRLDAQETLPLHISEEFPHAWIQRFNSIGIVAPIVERTWNQWWNFDSLGKAMCALIWISELLYDGAESFVFGESVLHASYLSDNDTLFGGAGWLDENLNFLRRTLQINYLESKLHDACKMLSEDDYSALSVQIHENFQRKRGTLDERVAKLIEELARNKS